MLDERAIVIEFQKRRKHTWVVARWWVLPIALCVLFKLVKYINDPTAPLEMTFSLICFTMVAVSIVRLTYIIRAHYLCPACEQVPMGPVVVK